MSEMYDGGQKDKDWVIIMSSNRLLKGFSDVLSPNLSEMGIGWQFGSTEGAEEHELGDQS
jgi:hypothetical protein